MDEKINPAVIAVITAALQTMCGTGKVVAVKIKRNETWALASKINR